MGLIGSSVRLLDVEPDLGEDLDFDQRELALRNSLVRVVKLQPGSWSPSAVAPSEPGSLGVLVLSGGSLRREHFVGRVRAEPVGSGDLVRAAEDESGTFPTDVTWHAMTALRLAVLDRRFVTRMAVFPSVFERLVDRLSGRMAARGHRHLISAHPGLPDRLLLTFRQLVERYGRTSTEGLVLPWPLSQRDLAELVGASRQSVNGAVQRLRESGVLEQQADRSWRLSHGPVIGLGDLVELTDHRESAELARSALSAS